MPATQDLNAPLKPARIAVVDDEKAHMRALCDALATEGFDAVGFSSPREALAGLKRAPAELVLTDLMMPEMDGIAFLRSARESDPSLTAIMMTGEGSIATAVEAMKAGALDYILKPFKLGTLMPVLMRALSVRRLRVENARLQRNVAERTAELEAANAELEAFSYSVSHDLRAPLRHVAGYAELMREHEATLPTDARELLASIAAGAERMNRLIEDLLEFSRMGRQALARRRVDVAGLVRETLAELEGERRGRNVELVVGELPDCDGDAALLKQVFVNLLSNALKFTRGREQARVEVGSRLEGGETVYFVRDNGAGFDMAHAERLFGVFQRLHRADQFEGTGVGLSLVRRIVQRHGGRIWAEAAVERGAAFHFTLPAAEPS